MIVESGARAPWEEVVNYQLLHVRSHEVATMHVRLLTREEGGEPGKLRFPRILRIPGLSTAARHELQLSEFNNLVNFRIYTN